MSSVAVFAGLDYHQDSIQVCVLDQEGAPLVNRSVASEAAAVRQAVMHHGRPRRVAMEACCGASNLAHQLRDDYGLPVELAHPGYVARMKRSPDKSDFSDAQLLADLVRVNYLPQVWLAPDYIRQLRRLSRHRQQLVNRRRDVKLRIRAILRDNRLKCQHANAWTKAWVVWLLREADLAHSDRWIMQDHVAELKSLDERILAVEKRIVEFTANDAIMAHLRSLEGVGLVTALTLRAEIGCFQRFQKAKQLSRFCSVSPRNASSGQRQADAGLIKAGNPLLRAVLIELAHRLIRKKGHWSQLAATLLARGKQKNIVVAAVANRWARWLHHEMRRFQTEQPTSAGAQQKGLRRPLLTTTTT